MKLNYFDINKHRNEYPWNRQQEIKTKKLLSLYFNNKYMDSIQIEISNRGKLFWFNTKNKVNVFGFWNKKERPEGKFYESWGNDGTMCS